jgi:hypothetical protein
MLQGTVEKFVLCRTPEYWRDIIFKFIGGIIHTYFLVQWFDLLTYRVPKIYAVTYRMDSIVKTN